MTADITQNKHFAEILETRVVCDASTHGLGATLEKKTPEGWQSHIRQDS